MSVIKDKPIRLTDLVYSRSMKISPAIRFLSAFLSTLVLGLLLPASALAAYTKYPRIGDCFLHTNAQVSAEFATKNPISCSKRHNVEIYHVGLWPSETPPWQMSDEEAVNVAASVCATQRTFERLNESYFNYWAWFTPNKKQWNKGQRWLRCDGMYVMSARDKNDPSTYIFRTWTGKRI